MKASFCDSLFSIRTKSGKIRKAVQEERKESGSVPMRKTVFFDIDGTLWDEQMRIPASTTEAIRALREAGNYAFLCSGRSRAAICSEKLLGIGFDGMVAACGAYVDFCGDIVYEQLLTQEQAAHALAVIRRHHMLAVLEGPRYIYVNLEDFGDDPYVIYLRKELGENVKTILGTDTFEINKLSIDLKGADMDLVARELEEMFDLVIHNDWLMEVLPKEHSKATGIALVCEHLGVAKEDTYAFGDSANDLDMFGFVPHGIAMGNGTEAAKRAAEYVTTDIMDDGIRNGLLHYGLI